MTTNLFVCCWITYGVFSTFVRLEDAVLLEMFKFYKDDRLRCLFWDDSGERYFVGNRIHRSFHNTAANSTRQGKETMPPLLWKESQAKHLVVFKILRFFGHEYFLQFVFWSSSSLFVKRVSLVKLRHLWPKNLKMVHLICYSYSDMTVKFYPVFPTQNNEFVLSCHLHSKMKCVTEMYRQKNSWYIHSSYILSSE